MIAILFTAALAIFMLWYLIIYFDEDIESEEDTKKTTDFLKSTGMGIKFTVDDVKQTFKED